jgi:spore maturation protein CgeB
MRKLNIYVCLILEKESFPWHQQITQSLRAMGHCVYTPSNIGLGTSWHLLNHNCWSRRDAERINEAILSHIEELQTKQTIDLFFCYLYPFQFTPDLFSQLHDLNIPSLYFFCDNLSYEDVARQYASKATLNWVPEKLAISQFRRAGARWIYLPMAANPDINFPVPQEETIDISFFGSKNSYRRDLIGRILRSGLNIKVFGNGWRPDAIPYYAEHNPFEGPVPSSPTRAMKMMRFLKWKKNAFLRFLQCGLKPRQRSMAYQQMGKQYENELRSIAVKSALNMDEANQVYSMSAISLGINDHFKPERTPPFLTYTKLRDFEATMAGACYLTQNTPEGPELFTDEKEVMRYSSIEELIDKAKFLLKSPEYRKKLREAGRKRALAEHTWVHRFEKVFDELGL